MGGWGGEGRERKGGYAVRCLFKTRTQHYKMVGNSCARQKTARFPSLKRLQFFGGDRARRIGE
eukprot:6294842-Pyramimonas_sp.AAC.1